MRSREALVLNFGQILESRFPRFVTRNQSSAAALGKGLRLLFCENRFQRFEQDYPAEVGRQNTKMHSSLDIARAGEPGASIR